MRAHARDGVDTTTTTSAMVVIITISHIAEQRLNLALWFRKCYKRCWLFFYWMIVLYRVCSSSGTACCKYNARVMSGLFVSFAVVPTYVLIALFAIAVTCRLFGLCDNVRWHGSFCIAFSLATGCLQWFCLCSKVFSSL